VRYDPERVKRIYDQMAGVEDRMEKEPSLRTEIPREFIRKYLKSSDLVLDAGGGAGINAVWMAQRCMRVTLLDISPRVLRHAAANVAEAGLAHKIALIRGDISDLKQFKKGQFSFVVCVGDAISYVLGNRFKALRELVRVAKKGSVLVIGCDSKYGFMRLSLAEGYLDEAVRMNRTHETTCGMGPRTHVYKVDEMKRLLEVNGCEVLEVASTPTLTDAVDWKRFRGPGNWAKLKKLELELCIKPELLGLGNHLLFVARKK